jgi:hypothetical protein
LVPRAEIPVILPGDKELLMSFIHFSAELYSSELSQTFKRVVTNALSEQTLSAIEPGHSAGSLAVRSIPTGVAVLLLILLMIWQFAGENVLPAIALAILSLALAAFCPEPS